jgi:hypothetical protein
MKYGVCYLQETGNIGDDIWAYSAYKLMPQCDYFIDLRDIRNFRSDNNEDVAVLMSGVVITEKTLNDSFLPSANIIPKFISTHFRSGSYDWLRRDMIYKYLKAYEPVGARDYYTMDNLKSIGIDSYFSGCVSLTLNPPKKNQPDEQKYVCLVDVPDSAKEYVNCILKGSSINVKEMTHDFDIETYTSYPIQKRFETVEQYLDIYANAHCVITDRLHVALPCLAFETPVLVLKEPCCEKDESFNRRFYPYRDYFHFSYTNNFVSGQNVYPIKNPPKNKGAYKKYRKEVIESCSEFFSSTLLFNKFLQNEFDDWFSKTISND